MQYCFERENTLPPFTCLEANGEPRLEYTEQGELIIFPLKVQPRLICHSLRREMSRNKLNGLERARSLSVDEALARLGGSLFLHCASSPASPCVSALPHIGIDFEQLRLMGSDSR